MQGPSKPIKSYDIER